MGKKFHGVLLFLLVLVNVAVAREFPGVKDLMTDQEFTAAGLNKLSPEELKALNNWLLKYTTDDVPELVEEVPELQESIALKAAVTPEPEPEAKSEPEPEKIVSRIKGNFKGWKGRTVFKLENGQVWKQRQPGRYSHKVNSPEVEISRNVMGFYMMEVVDTGKRIGVKRIQ